MFASRLGLVSAVGLLLLAAGCHLHTKGHGDKKTVEVGTPFGSVHLQQFGSTGVGLSAFPGATPVHTNGENSGSADVDFSFGNFKLEVHTVELLTTAPQEEVLRFYRKDMARYGTTVLCRGKQPVGGPAQTPQGLACDSDGNHTLEEGDTLQLRAGSQQHQHIVGVRTENGSTHIALVALDLPSGLSTKDDDNRE